MKIYLENSKRKSLEKLSSFSLMENLKMISQTEKDEILAETLASCIYGYYKDRNRGITNVIGKTVTLRNGKNNVVAIKVECKDGNLTVSVTPEEKESAYREELISLFEDNYPKRQFLRNYFEVLYEHKWTGVNPNEACNMYEIQKFAKRRYPYFANAPEEKQREVLEKAYRMAMAKRNSSRDKFTFAKAMFYTMYDEGMTGKTFINGAVYEKLIDICHPTKNAIKRKTSEDTLSYTVFETGCHYKLCVAASDLWKILVGEGRYL